MFLCPPSPKSLASRASFGASILLLLLGGTSCETTSSPRSPVHDETVREGPLLDRLGGSPIDLIDSGYFELALEKIEGGEDSEEFAWPIQRTLVRELPSWFHAELQAAVLADLEGNPMIRTGKTPCQLVVVGVSGLGVPVPVLLSACLGDCEQASQNCVGVTISDPLSRRTRLYCNCGPQRLMVNPPPPPPADCHLELRSKPGPGGRPLQFVKCAPPRCLNGNACKLRVLRANLPGVFPIQLTYFLCECP